MSDVKPAVGQLWKDNDPRIRLDRGCDRFVHITEIVDGKAICESWYDEPGSPSRTVRISVRRFKPTSTGYTFVRDMSGVPS